MANKARSTNQDQVSSSSKLRAGSRQTLNSSLNQLNTNRLQEKNDLQTLNDRHASVVNMQDELRRKNHALHEQLRVTEETCENRIRECQSFCERKVDQLSAKLDLERRNSTKKEMEL